MSNFVITYFVLYFVLIGTIVFLGYYLQRLKEQKHTNGDNHILLDELVVLIPFRNEEHRLSVLLDSLKNLKVYPKLFVFINDHSTDKSVELIMKELESINYSIIELPEEIAGKKMALRYATEQTNSRYILTIDADVELSKDYFLALSELGDADMYVLPAIMKAESLKEYFYEIDLILVNAANAGLSGLSRPIMASGANLLYRRDTFNSVDNIQSHIASASGDDTYLLRDFRESNSFVRLSSDVNCAIYTETPQSLKEFIDQRLRWIGKTGDMKDHLSTSLALIQAVLTVFFLLLVIYYVAFKNWENLLVIFGTKTLIDMLVFMPYFARIRRLTTWLFIPIYEILFPLYVLLIFSLMFVYKPKWKGRTIYNIKR